MSLFAIGDLHLPGGCEKPMDIFGPQWDRHFFRISEAWKSLVREKDTVLIPGDISWAMQLTQAAEDLNEIGKLPGKKVLIRGNHDYWWSSVTKIRSMLPPGMTALQHDAADMGDFVVCGTRGWTIPTEDEPLQEQDRKIYAREMARLKLALEAATGIAHGRPIVVMIHYPPLYQTEPASGFTELMEEYGAQICVYGHLHGAGIKAGYNGERNGIRYYLTSCDSIGFAPLKIGIKN
ncbi:MAG: metallophosphoesterase [Clostridia bacterium]|nr:metallophosphoesterase [Clostridia bacterium]